MKNPTYEFKAVSENASDLTKFTNIEKYEHVLFHLKANFHRKWKHVDGSSDYIRGVQDVLNELRNALSDINLEDL